MSRSNPTDVGIPNPSKRWFEWNGETGTVRYYDKEAKQNVDVGSDFTFILLDQLGSVKGWHDASDSGIYSNEVKDTVQEPLVVKSFKGGILAEGIYRQIRDKVKAAGGYFAANCYIGFKNGSGAFEIGSLRFKGAALNAWVEFSKAHRAELYSVAVRINGFTEGKKGRIVYRVPILSIKTISPETNTAAIALDKELQEFLKSYFKRTKREQVEAPHVADESMMETDQGPQGAGPVQELTDDDIPF